jgi:hypothetical protein
MWFFLGIVLAVVLILMIMWLRSRKIVVAWYEWLIATLGLLLLLVALQNYSTSKVGYEPTAPGIFLLVLGLPALFLILISVGFVCWRWFRKNRVKTVKA